MQACAWSGYRPQPRIRPPRRDGYKLHRRFFGRGGGLMGAILSTSGHHLAMKIKAVAGQGQGSHLRQSTSRRTARAAHRPHSRLRLHPRGNVGNFSPRLRLGSHISRWRGNGAPARPDPSYAWSYLLMAVSPSVRISVSGARGESQADKLRRIGQHGVLPSPRKALP